MYLHVMLKNKIATYAINMVYFCAAVGIDMRRAIESFLYKILPLGC